MAVNAASASQPEFGESRAIESEQTLDEARLGGRLS
jgi:hypothetical protein